MLPVLHLLKGRNTSSRNFITAVNLASWRVLSITNTTTGKTGQHQWPPNSAGHDTEANRTTTTRQQLRYFSLPPAQPQAASCHHKHKNDWGSVLPRRQGWSTLEHRHGVMPKFSATSFALFFLWASSGWSFLTILPKLMQSGFAEIKSPHKHSAPTQIKAMLWHF